MPFIFPNPPKKLDDLEFGIRNHGFPVIHRPIKSHKSHQSPKLPSQKIRKNHPKKNLPEAAPASQKFSLDPKSKRCRHSFLGKKKRPDHIRMERWEETQWEMGGVLELPASSGLEYNKNQADVKTQHNNRHVFVFADVSPVHLEVFGAPGCHTTPLVAYPFPKRNPCFLCWISSSWLQ